MQLIVLTTVSFSTNHINYLAVTRKSSFSETKASSSSFDARSFSNSSAARLRDPTTPIAGAPLTCKKCTCTKCYIGYKLYTNLPFSTERALILNLWIVLEQRRSKDVASMFSRGGQRGTIQIFKGSGTQVLVICTVKIKRTGKPGCQSSAPEPLVRRP